MGSRCTPELLSLAFRLGSEHRSDTVVCNANFTASCQSWRLAGRSHRAAYSHERERENSRTDAMSGINRRLSRDTRHVHESSWACVVRQRRHEPVQSRPISAGRRSVEQVATVHDRRWRSRSQPAQRQFIRVAARVAAPSVHFA
jgi:hypothetical protein